MSGETSSETGNPHARVWPFAKFCSEIGGRLVFAHDDFSPEELRLEDLDVIYPACDPTICSSPPTL